MTPAQSWAAFLMCLALAGLLIYIGANAGKHRDHPDRVDDWDAYWTALTPAERRQEIRMMDDYAESHRGEL